MSMSMSMYLYICLYLNIQIHMRFKMRVDIFLRIYPARIRNVNEYGNVFVYVHENMYLDVNM